ncbi:hypothetical protein SAMD00019534_008740 [Acytostelium subglobosum LB1]|uniref:hypothetical protein n=1 Tax=Acytostelium subglobosum LB1 TaxID=1410327 RepID=UPI000644E763|nr:hypothetical protein SAMD00019534_008740 [Acytostelium subglobosum LB1]GAM17699.1 hypothetical protein SAMD00019534_008740 [Acytostelium subglobosum LB1]|eukprot:XP_012758295.1 hypothetical protein SAMD00019534_008740 [Acytostelium subglobosum LB1]
MNKFITIALVFSVLCFGIASADIWSYCTGNINPTFNINTLTLTPDPPKIGQVATVNLQGTLTEEITSGSSVFSIEYFVAGAWRALPDFDNDVCSVVTCPVQTGPFTFSTQINIPFITPRGNYRGQLIMNDQTGRNITCLTFATTLNP